MKINLTSIGTIIAVFAGLGTIVAGFGFVLDMFYIPRAEFNATQSAYNETLKKLDTLELGLTNLTKIFLKGEIANLNRVIDKLKSIEDRSDAENDYLFRLKNDVTDLQNQLNEL